MSEVWIANNGSVIPLDSVAEISDENSPVLLVTLRNEHSDSDALRPICSRDKEELIQQRNSLLDAMGGGSGKTNA